MVTAAQIADAATVLDDIAADLSGEFIETDVLAIGG